MDINKFERKQLKPVARNASVYVMLVDESFYTMNRKTSLFLLPENSIKIDRSYTYRYSYPEDICNNIQRRIVGTGNVCYVYKERFYWSYVFTFLTFVFLFKRFYISGTRDQEHVWGESILRCSNLCLELCSRVPVLWLLNAILNYIFTL